MMTKRIATILFASLVSIFLVTSGLSIALTGGNQVQTYGSGLVDGDHEDPTPIDDDETDGDDEEEDEGGEEHRHREEHDEEEPEWDQLIGFEGAVEIALNETNGTVKEFELEGEDDGYLYKLEIINETKKSELKIDAYSGEVLEFEIDDDEEDYLPEWDKLIGHEEALEIALNETNGTVVKFELSEDDESYIYEIELIEDGEEHELKIEAYTGDILEFEAEDDREERHREREHHKERGIGRFWNGTEGRFISFELIENGIKNYTLNTSSSELLLFDNVTVENLTIEENKSEKVFYELKGNDTEIRIFDVAPALMKIEVETEDSENRTVSFDLGDLKVVGQDGPNMVLSYGNYTAKLLSVTRGEGGWNSSLNISVEDGTVNYTFKDELFLVFRMTDLENDEEMEENFSKAISEGKAGGEVVVDGDDKEVSDISVNYSDIQMETEVKEKNRVQVKVSSETLEEGRVVALKVYKDVVNVDNAEDLKVMFDGEEISMADDYEDLINTDDGAEYLVSVGSEEIQVLVMVPHFSTHTIEIAKAEMGTGIQYYLPVVIIAVIGVLAAIWAVNKKK